MQRPRMGPDQARGQRRGALALRPLPRTRLGGVAVPEVPVLRLRQLPRPREPGRQGRRDAAVPGTRSRCRAWVSFRFSVFLPCFALRVFLDSDVLVLGAERGLWSLSVGNGALLALLLGRTR